MLIIRGYWPIIADFSSMLRNPSLSLIAKLWCPTSWCTFFNQNSEITLLFYFNEVLIYAAVLPHLLNTQHPAETPECSADLPVPLAINWTAQVSEYTQLHTLSVERGFTSVQWMSNASRLLYVTLSTFVSETYHLKDLTHNKYLTHQKKKKKLPIF